MSKMKAGLSAMAALATLAVAVAPAGAQDYRYDRSGGYYDHHHYYHRSNCYAQRRRSGNEGTALGAVSGGVLGGVIGHSVVGGLVGAGVGAVAGHEIAKNRVHC